MSRSSPSPGDDPLDLIRWLAAERGDAAVFEVDAERRVRSWDRAAEELFGYSSEVALGMELSRLLIPGPAEAGASVTAEGLRADGSRFPCRFLVAPVPTAPAAPVAPEDGQWVCIARLEVPDQEWSPTEQRSRLASFGRSVALAMTAGGSLADMLSRACTAMVDHLEAAFGRIWLLSADGATLELVASAGLYTHLDGRHGRIPVGAFKIGAIAASGEPHLTNRVVGDSRVSDQEWARREGMRAFAGYPLKVDNRIVGVMAMFSRRRLAPATLDAMATVADAVAMGVDRKQSELALLAEQRYLQVTLASIGDAVVATDLAGRVRFLNMVAEELTGVRAVDAVGRPVGEIFQLVHEASGVSLANPVDSVLATGTAGGSGGEAVLLCRDGRRIPIEESAAPIRGEAEELIGVVLVFRDAGERRRAERSLRTSEARKAAILDAALDAIVTIDGESIVLEFNPAAEALFGRSKEEALGRDIASLIIPERLRESHRKGLRHFASTGEAPVLNQRLELPALHADGHEFPVELAITKVESGDDVVFTAYLRDLSDRARSERLRVARLNLATALAEAQDAEEAIHAVLQAACESFEWDAGFHWAPEQDDPALTCRAAWHRPGLELEAFQERSRTEAFLPGEGLPGRAWAGLRPVSCRDVVKEGWFRRSGEASVDGVHGAFAVPLLVGGEPTGVLEFFSRQPRDADPEMLEMMATAASQVGQFLERKRYESGLHEQRFLAETLNRVGAILAPEVDPERIARLVADELMGLVGADSAAFLAEVVDDEGETLGVRVLAGRQAEAFGSFLDSRSARFLQPTCRGEGPFRVEDLATEPLEDGPAGGGQADGKRAPVRSLLAVPVVSRQGGSLGGLFLGHSEPRRFTGRDEQLALGLAGQASIALDTARLHRETRQFEQQFRQLAEHVRGVFWMTTADRSRVLYVSPAYEQLWGRSCESLLEDAASYFESVDDDDRPRLDAVRAAQLRGEPTSVEYRLVRPDGTVRWIWDRSFPVPDEDGRSYRIAGVAEDITDRKQAEDASRFLADAGGILTNLVDYESTLQKVASLAVPFFADWCAVDLVNAEGGLERLSVAHADPQKVRFVQELAERYPESPESPHGAYRVMRTGEPDWAPSIDSALLKGVAQDAEHLALLESLGLRSYICVPLQTRNVLLGVLTFVSAESGRVYDEFDVQMAGELAARAAVAIENARLYADLREADRRKDDFLAMLAHELRNPLAPLRTGLELLAMKEKVDPDTVERMQTQVRHLVRLVDDLLDVSRIVRGKIKLRREVLELQGLLDDCLAAARPWIEARGLSLKASGPTAPVWVRADPVRLHQVIENLLNNAAKYTEPGGRIEVAAREESGSVVLSVSDDGIGIDSRLLPRVFDLFTQSSRSLDRAEGGLGIGLTLVKSLVVLHGGEVEAHSDGPGCGSRFVVSLPTSARPRTRARAEKQRKGLRARRVLVVDDNVDAAEMLVQLLQELGVPEVEVAHDGLSAIEAVRRFRPDTMLLDIGLPGLDGLVVAERLRREEGLSRLLIVAVTGYGQEEDRRRTREAGCDEHLVKPIAVEALREVLSHEKLPEAAGAEGD